jgi:hypothetical protein
VARILAIVADLLLASRVQESLRAAGHEVRVVQALPEAVDADVEAIVCDLDLADPAAVAALGPPALGFYSHVEAATRRAAEEAGVDLVVPRSRMSRELPELVERLLSDGG